MKQNILKEIKDTDNKIKKVFDDFIEQRKRTSQLLQTSYEQLKTSSFHHNNSKSLNVSREITLEGAKNDETKEIKLTDQSSPDHILRKHEIYTQENEDQEYFKDEGFGLNGKQNEKNRFNISQDTEDLLKSNDDLDIEFPLSLRQMNQTLSANQNKVQLNNSLQHRRLSNNSLRTSMESLNDDSLLSSLHNNSIFDRSQVQQQSLYPTGNAQPQQQQLQQFQSTKDNAYSSIKNNKKPLGSCLKIRESEIDFGKLYVFSEVKRTFEILNTSDSIINLRVFFETGQFELDQNIIQIPEFSATKITIKCFREEELRIFDSLHIQEDLVSNNYQQNEMAEHSDNRITLLVKAQILKPQLIIKSEQNMYISGQFTTIEVKQNDLGEIIIYLTNPLSELQSDIEVDVVQKQNDQNKITFFPQNFILKQQETKKVSFTISNKNNQIGTTQIFCVFFKINSSPIIFATKVIYG